MPKLRNRGLTFLLLGLLIGAPLVGCDALNPPIGAGSTPSPGSALKGTPGASSSDRPVAKVKRGDLTTELQVRGRVVASQELLLSFHRTGWIKTLNVKIGDQVEQGALIAEMEDPDLEDVIADANLALEKARADLAAAVTQVQADLEAARLKLERQKDLLARGMAAATDEVNAKALDLEVARLKLEKVKTQKADQTDIAIAEAELRSAEAALQVAKANKDDRVGQFLQQKAVEAARLKLEKQKALQADTTDVSLAEAAVRSAEAALSTAQRKLQELDTADVALAEDTVRSLESALQQAKAKYDRAVETEQTNATARDASIQLKQTAVRLAEGEVERLRKRADDLKLVAPFAGNIVSLDAQVGGKVEPHQTLGILANPADVLVEASVPEESMGWVSPGQEAQVALDGYANQRYRARVTQLASTPTLWQGKRVYQVRLQFEGDAKAPSTIRMGSDIFFNVTKSDVLVVPIAALSGDGDRRYVEVVSGGSTTRFPVTVGMMNHTDAEIVSGLREGDTVALRAGG